MTESSAFKVAQPGGHFDQLLRQTRVHHQQLSYLADQKANMLLTASSLVLTLSLPLLLQPTLRWAAIALAVSALATILLASYATMPSRGSTKPRKPASGGAPANILFFGHFAHLTYEEFEASFEEILNDPSLAYQAQVIEIYGLGCYLAAHKFRFLRWAYFSFLSGLLIAAVLAIIAK